MKNSVENAIRNTAAKNINGKYNLSQYKKEGTKYYDERNKALLHKRICEEITAFADSHKEIPFYFILQVGVSKGAFKMSEFERGYKSFNADKVKQVHAMGMEYNKYNGLEGKKMSDVTIRLIMRYFEKVSTNFETFIKDLNKSQKLGKQCGARGNYEMLCKNLNIPIKVKEDTTHTTENHLSKVA